MKKALTAIKDSIKLIIQKRGEEYTDEELERLEYFIKKCDSRIQELDEGKNKPSMA